MQDPELMACTIILYRKLNQRRPFPLGCLPAEFNHQTSPHSTNVSAPFT